MKFKAFLASALILAASAARGDEFVLSHSFEKQPAYGLAILGMKPGMSIDEITAAAEAHGQKLQRNEAQLQMSMGSLTKTWPVLMDLNSDYGGYSNFYGSKSVKDFDFLTVKTTSAATGEVVSVIGRSTRKPLSENDFNLESIVASLTENFGSAPHKTDRGYIWTVGSDGAFIDATNCMDSPPLSFINEQDSDKKPDCTASYEVSEIVDTAWGWRTIRFKLSDHDMIHRDNQEITSQINAAFAAPAKKSDMDL